MSGSGHAQDLALPGVLVEAPAALVETPAVREAPAERRFSAISATYGRRRYLTRRLLLLADATGFLLALTVMLATSQHDRPVGYALLGFLGFPLWLGVFKSYGLYERDIKRISHSTVDDLPWILHALLVGCLLLWVFYKLLPTSRLTLDDIIVLASIATLTTMVLRSVARRLTPRLLGPERVLFIGDGDPTELLVRKLKAHPEYGLEPIGVVTPADSGSPDRNGTLPRFVIDELDVGEVLDRSRADRVVICRSELNQAALLDLMHRCKGRGVNVSVLPELFGAMGSAVEVDDIEGVTVLGVNPPVFSRSSRLMKRSLDVIGAASVLVLSAPLMLLLAALIKVDSRGPVFFKQRRIGAGGKPFRLVKLRTMVVGAEDRTEELLRQSQDPGWLKLDHDPRVTRVGRFLRLTSLDELPGLWNVLKGEMSLVGPRPLIESEDWRIEGPARSRLDLTPGVTGLWQVLGRTNIPFEEMVKLDYLYVTNWSLWTDVRLILRTFPVIVTRRGAN